MHQSCRAAVWHPPVTRRAPCCLPFSMKPSVFFSCFSLICRAPWEAHILNTGASVHCAWHVLVARVLVVGSAFGYAIIRDGMAASGTERRCRSQHLGADVGARVQCVADLVALGLGRRLLHELCVAGYKTALLPTSGRMCAVLAVLCACGTLKLSPAGVSRAPWSSPCHTHPRARKCGMPARAQCVTQCVSICEALQQQG